MSDKTPSPVVDPRDALYECPGGMDQAGNFHKCGLQAVVTETGEDGWDGPYHCAKMKRLGPAPKLEE